MRLRRVHIKGFKSVVEKDTEPVVQLGDFHP